MLSSQTRAPVAVFFAALLLSTHPINAKRALLDMASHANVARMSRNLNQMGGLAKMEDLVIRMEEALQEIQQMRHTKTKEHKWWQFGHTPSASDCPILKESYKRRVARVSEDHKPSFPSLVNRVLDTRKVTSALEQAIQLNCTWLSNGELDSMSKVEDMKPKHGSPCLNKVRDRLKKAVKVGTEEASLMGLKEAVGIMLSGHSAACSPLAGEVPQVGANETSVRVAQDGANETIVPVEALMANARAFEDAEGLKAELLMIPGISAEEAELQNELVRRPGETLEVVKDGRLTYNSAVVEVASKLHRNGSPDQNKRDAMIQKVWTKPHSKSQDITALATDSDQAHLYLPKLVKSNLHLHQENGGLVEMTQESGVLVKAGPPWALVFYFYAVVGFLVALLIAVILCAGVTVIVAGIVALVIIFVFCVIGALLKALIDWARFGKFDFGSNSGQCMDMLFQERDKGAAPGKAVLGLVAVGTMSTCTIMVMMAR